MPVKQYRWKILPPFKRDLFIHGDLEERMIGVLGASTYEGILDSLNERTVVATRYGEVSVALGEVGGHPSSPKPSQ